MVWPEWVTVFSSPWYIAHGTLVSSSVFVSTLLQTTPVHIEFWDWTKLQKKLNTFIFEILCHRQSWLFAVSVDTADMDRTRQCCLVLSCPCQRLSITYLHSEQDKTVLSRLVHVSGRVLLTLWNVAAEFWLCVKQSTDEEHHRLLGRWGQLWGRHSTRYNNRDVSCFCITWHSKST